jgi:hypothetical protein
MGELIEYDKKTKINIQKKTNRRLHNRKIDKIDFELYLKSSNFISSNIKMASHLETELGKLRELLK